MSGDHQRRDAPSHAKPRHLRRLPIVLAAILVAICLVIFAAVIHSMWMTVSEESGSTRYDIASGLPIRLSDMDLLDKETAYIAITARRLDEESGTVTLQMSGHRVCDACRSLSLQLFALDGDPEDWWGLPPSETLDLPTETNPFSGSVTLPVAGHPQRYPLDAYDLQLAVALVSGMADGETEYMTSDAMRERQILVAVNEQIPRFQMEQPAVITVPPDAKDRGLVSALDLQFRRPSYLPLIAALLIALILISSVLSTVLQDTGEVFLGIGSIILGVWGISSIIVQTSYKGLTFIDLSLATVIMIVLLGITVRAALIVARRPGSG